MTLVFNLKTTLRFLFCMTYRDWNYSMNENMSTFISVPKIGHIKWNKNESRCD